MIWHHVLSIAGRRATSYRYFGLCRISLKALRRTLYSHGDGFEAQRRLRKSRLNHGAFGLAVCQSIKSGLAYFLGLKPATTCGLHLPLVPVGYSV